MNSSDWIGLGWVKKKRKENEFPSKLGNDGNGKGYIIYFSHWNNYRINLSFQCDSPLNPLYHSEFDVLDSLWKNLTLLTNKTALPIIITYFLSPPYLCLFYRWSTLVSWSRIGCLSPGRMWCFVVYQWCNTNARATSPWLAVTTIESQRCRRGKSNFTVHSVVNVLL